MRYAIFTILLLSSIYNCKSQPYGFYRYIHNKGMVQEIYLDRNLNFNYEFKFDLFKDKAEGTYKVFGDTIILNYLTKDYKILTFKIDTINLPSSSTESGIPLKVVEEYSNKFPIISATHRPIKMLYRRNRLILIESKDNDVFKNNKKVIYKKPKVGKIE